MTLIKRPHIPDDGMYLTNADKTGRIHQIVRKYSTTTEHSVQSNIVRRYQIKQLRKWIASGQVFVFPAKPLVSCVTCHRQDTRLKPLPNEARANAS